MWIEIFKAGTHRDSQGNEKSFGGDDLEGIARSYNEKLSSSASFIAPLVKGHPETDGPACGWVDRLACRGDKLLARVKGISSSVIREIKEGLFRKISMALYPDNTLRHVGLLGASPPAVKGLEPVAFSATGSAFSVFASEGADTLPPVNGGVEENADTGPEFSEFLEKNLKNFPLPVKEKYAEFYRTLSDAPETGEYAEKAQSLLDSFRELVAETGRCYLFSEIAGNEITDIPSEFSEANVSPYKLKLHNDALALMHDNDSLTYEAAVHMAAGLYK